MSYRAHLNGGPRDDEYIDVERPVLFVTMMQRLQLVEPLDESPTAAAYRVGEYHLRRDSFGRPVPHNMAGVVEFDFQMDKGGAGESDGAE